MVSQLDASLSVGLESTFGTPVTTTRAYEFTQETLTDKITSAQGNGLRPGHITSRATRRVVQQEDPSGAVTIDVPTAGLGLLLNAAFGSVTNELAENGSTTATKTYQQVHTPLWGAAPTLTVQKCVPDLDGNVQPYTYDGMTVSKLTLDAKQGSILTAAIDLSGRAVTQGALNAFDPLHYVDAGVYSFVDGSIVLASSATAPTATALGSGTPVAGITDASIDWETGLDGKGWTFGSGVHRGRRQQRLLAKLSGKMTAELIDPTMPTAYLKQQRLAMLLTFAYSQPIEDGFNPTLQVYMPCVLLDGDLPQVNGAAVRTVSASFTGYETDDGQPPITVVYRTADATL